ncbi:MAG TPA: lipoyl synthase [Nitriliruptoraceae bacterium]|nr:lipoyl synthase [Nitriliruptoraceae bacterium]
MAIGPDWRRSAGAGDGDTVERVDHEECDTVAFDSNGQPVIPDGVRTLDVLGRERTQRAGVVRKTIDTSLQAERKPEWLKVKASFGENFTDLKRLMGDLELNTVCEQARCPNIYECWEMREATFLIGGEDCTRRCGFCQIKTGKPAAYDRDEPRRVAEAVTHLGLRFVVVTMVARDDLDDKGAWLIAETIRQVRATTPDVGIEVLPSDFGYGHEPAVGARALEQVVATPPDVFAFNLETCRRLFREIRPSFDYDRGLEFLSLARERFPSTTAIKSNIIAGMGETDDEIIETMTDIRRAGVQLLTIGQYLQPSAQHLHLDRYVTPESFARFKAHGEDVLGFDHVESGPMVRSSYHAGDQANDAGAWSPDAKRLPVLG